MLAVAESSVWFDDVGISAFHICVVVDLWQSLSDISAFHSCVVVVDLWQSF
jgi:hypothetical protein